MLEELLRYLNNYFDIDRRFGTFTVQDGSIELPFLQSGQYFRIVGSVFNDGVYQYPAADLTDESFTGAVWALAVPRAVVESAEEVEQWQRKNGEAAASPYQSESFGGYSYSKKSDSQSGNAPGWQGAFAARLERWRKL